MTKKVIDAFKAMGPYVALEIFMPGGTLFAILLWYARKRLAAAQAQS